MEKFFPKILLVAAEPNLWGDTSGVSYEWDSLVHRLILKECLCQI